MEKDPERERLDAEGEPDKGQSGGDNAPMKMSRIGFDFMGAVLGSALLGWLIDRNFGTKPWGLMVLILLGFGVGVMNVWRAIQKAGNDK
jgi:ATP synthase protein I